MNVLLKLFFWGNEVLMRCDVRNTFIGDLRTYLIGNSRKAWGLTQLPVITKVVYNRQFGAVG